MFKFLFFSTALWGWLLLTGTARAADLSFTVSPMTTELSLAPGTQQTQTLTVKDDRPPTAPATPLCLKVYLMDWTLTRDGSPRFAEAGTLPGNCSSWAQVNPPEITLLPGQTQTVRCTLSVPADAQGTTHTMLMFQAAAQPMSVHSENVAVSGRIGASVYVAAGPQARRARIVALSSGAGKTRLTVENTGSTLLRLKGTLQWRGASGGLLATAALPPVVILPGAEGVRDVVLDTPTLPADAAGSTVTALLDYGGDVLLGARAHVSTP